MVYNSNCPYKQLTAPPCWRCSYFNADMNECGLNLASGYQSGEKSNITGISDSYERRLANYEYDRNELLKLTKEQLVDLIIHKPEF